MTPVQRSDKACHTCRRQRLKCDRSLPECQKCASNDRECLGYQGLFRWEQGVASRGKMAGKTLGRRTRIQVRDSDSCAQSSSTSSPSSRRSSLSNAGVVPLNPLTDPLYQDLDITSRKYLSYFASDVCKDLVLYDTIDRNPFRQLIPWTTHNLMLLQVIIATSALHMSNATRKPSDPERLAVYRRDALLARQNALLLLKSALGDIDSIDVDVTLAVVLLFIQFELIDSGRDGWKHHIKGARAIIKRLLEIRTSNGDTMSPLRGSLISECLILDIVGSTFTNPAASSSDDAYPKEYLSLLKDAEGNHCSSFPTELLQLIQSGSRLLSPPGHVSSSSGPNPKDGQHLLTAAEAFDPQAWATDVQARSPSSDLEHRAHLASAHRAATCVYLSRILLSVSPTAHSTHDFESMVADVVNHLSFIQQDNALFGATTWPAFVAGAETDEPMQRAWVKKHFNGLWEVQPWSNIKATLTVLDRIWAQRKTGWERAKNGRWHEDKRWIQLLREWGHDWLIL